MGQPHLCAAMFHESCVVKQRHGHLVSKENDKGFRISHSQSEAILEPLRETGETKETESKFA